MGRHEMFSLSEAELIRCGLK